jgi:hypothetical protein
LYVKAGAAVLISALAVAVTTLGSVGALFLDDLALLALAQSTPWPSPDYLATVWFGHLSPAGLLIAWIESRLFGLFKPWYGITQGAAILATAILLNAVIKAVVGNRAVRLVPLALFRMSMSVAAAAGWWANALWVVPLMCIILLAMRTMISTGRRTQSSTTYHILGLVIAGLLFTEKAALIPFGLFALDVARRNVPIRTAAVQTWRVWRPLWLGSLTILGLYAVIYLSLANGFLGTKPFESLVGDPLSVAYQVWIFGFPAGQFGGPINWANPILSNPPPPFLVYSRVLLLLLLSACLWANPASRRQLTWAAAYLTVIAPLMATARNFGAWMFMIVMQIRYYADSVVWFAIALAYAMPRFTIGAKLRQSRKAVRAAYASIVSVWAIASCLAWGASFGVIESNTGDPILLSDFYGALVGEDKFTESSDSPVLYRGRGELANVRALGHFAQPASPACLRPDRPTGKIPLPAPLFPNFHLVTAVGIADADASVRLTLDGRPGGSLAWRDGKDTTTSWVEGGGAIVHLELTAGDSACITSVEVGPAQVLQVLPR